MEKSSPVQAEAALAFHRGDRSYELIGGRRVELAPMSVFAIRTASRLAGKLGSFTEANDLGETVLEMLFRLPLPDEPSRRPDVAFVSYQRWPRDRPVPEEEDVWNVVPDLAVEVVSPAESAEDLQQKVDEYFKAGVQQVWIVYPRRRAVHVYETPMQVRGLTRTEVLEGGKVLPGFQLPLTTLFQDRSPPA